jgi:hypothetical protein
LSLTVHSTGDVSLDLLRGLASELEPDIRLHVEERQHFFRSIEPPSYISFLADASWWIKVFGGMAALYVAELVREAAKETWKSRAKIASKMQEVSTRPLRGFAKALSKTRVQLKPHARIKIGLPVPDDFFAAQLLLEGPEQDLVEAQIALFVYHLPALIKLIKSERLDSGGAFGAIQLQLLEDGSLEVRWLNPEIEKECQRILSLDAP